MTYRPRSPVTIEHAAVWLAIVRIAVGLYFVKSLVTKMSVVLLGGFLPFPAVSDRWIGVMPKIVAKQAAENPILFYKHFLEGTVLTHSELFAHLTAWGETVVGIGLTLGPSPLVAGRIVPGGELRSGDPMDVAGTAGVSPLLTLLMIVFSSPGRAGPSVSTARWRTPAQVHLHAQAVRLIGS
jgi:hypothetical protein